MITAASLKAYTVKDLAQMARKRGVAGSHSMRKDQLVRALLRVARSGNKPKPSGRNSSAHGNSSSGPRASNSSNSNHRGTATSGSNASTSGSNASGSGTSGVSDASGSGRNRGGAARGRSKKVSRVTRRLQKAIKEQERLKDLASSAVSDKSPKRKKKCKPVQPIVVERDRIVLMVRDSYWLHACWELSRQNVERARAAMAEHWHTAKPLLRVHQVETGTTTSTSTQWIRDIVIHGGVRNWYIDVTDPPQSYLVEIGYCSETGKFFTMARSNIVTTPRPGSYDSLDENWAEVAENYERVYAMSGGNDETNQNGELQDLFEERLRRPMGAPLVTRYGSGANSGARLDRDFYFDVDAEIIIYGATKPSAYVTLAGEPVKIRPDGTFTVRQSMPNKRQVLPVVADSRDGVEQRTIVLAIERNTKVMEPVIRESNE